MDDLLDLNWSSPPKPSSGSSSTAGSAAPGKAPSKSSTPKPSEWDFLASTSASASTASTSRIPQTAVFPPPRSTGTPNYYATPPLRGSTPQTAPLPTSSSLPKSSSPAPPNDAFSSLLSLSSSGGSEGGSLSMAEKQRQLEEQRRQKAEHEKAQWGHGEFWDKHGSSNGGMLAPTAAPAPGKPRSPPTSSGMSPQFANLLAPTPQAAPRAKPPPVISTAQKMGIWDDPAFSSLGVGSSSQSNSKAASPAPPPAAPSAGDELDFDLLDGSSRPPRANGNGTASAPRSGMRTPLSDFDFGDRASLSREDSPSPPLPSSPPRTRAPPKGGRSSPPPHIVGQIVEMGFTPSQARNALAKTSDGLNVQEALDMLLANGSTDDQVEVEWRRKQEEAERRRARRAGPSRESVQPRGGSGARDGRSARDGREGREGREDAGGMGAGGGEYDKYIAQASELSQTVFSKASSFWTAGKEKAMKVYEEQRRAMEAAKGAPPARDRPRWMEDAERENGGGWKDEAENGPAFADDTPPRPGGAGSGSHARSPPRQAHAPHASGRSPDAQPPSPAKEGSYRSVKERADLLFAEEPRSGYKSPSRHRKPATPSPAPPPPPVARAPTPKITRTLVDASPGQLSSAATAKAKGNEHFKLGRFSDADTSYTAAIAALPEGHLLLIPLWNNRAAAKLKLGEAVPAAGDCTLVIEMVGLGYHPSKENPLPAAVAEVKLGDALAKAVLKRAQAWEMAEKYKDALGDYERLISLDPSFAGGSRNLAVEGARRARQMLDPPKVKPAARAPVGKPPVRVSSPAVVGDSKSVQALRKAAAVTEGEDAQRLALKDGVDAKLAAWKNGKETNLRALIASLDTVLWESIMSGVKVGMGELITEKQVKIRYMKVIARLHPDKLDVKSTSVEQRMLANGVFGALNEAWQAFQNS